MRSPSWLTWHSSWSIRGMPLPLERQLRYGFLPVASFWLYTNDLTKPNKTERNLSCTHNLNAPFIWVCTPYLKLWYKIVSIFIMFHHTSFFELYTSSLETNIWISSTIILSIGLFFLRPLSDGLPSFAELSSGLALWQFRVGVTHSACLRQEKAHFYPWCERLGHAQPALVRWDILMGHGWQDQGSTDEKTLEFYGPLVICPQRLSDFYWA